jgi:hypothetical protein
MIRRHGLSPIATCCKWPWSHLYGWVSSILEHQPSWMPQVFLSCPRSASRVWQSLGPRVLGSEGLRADPLSWFVEMVIAASRRFGVSIMYVLGLSWEISIQQSVGIHYSGVVCTSRNTTVGAISIRHSATPRSFHPSMTSAHHGHYALLLNETSRVAGLPAVCHQLS